MTLACVSAEIARPPSSWNTLRLVLMLLLCGASLAAQARPQPLLTPGLTRALSTRTICTTRWRLDRRHVTIAMKRRVAAAYGVAWVDRAAYEFDHLIPRQLGGADDVRNLWPQKWVDGQAMGARAKDRTENATQQAVCAGRLSLKAAQRQMVADWTVLHAQLVGAPRRK